MWRRVRPFILKALAVIAVINILLLLVFIDCLTLDGWMLAAAVDIPSLVYLILLAYANGLFV